MSTLPVTRTCRRCRNTFHIMPHRLARLPGAGELCPACRFLGAAALESPERDSIPPPQRTWPCRLCGKHTANRFYCPEHLEALSAELGYDAGDYGLDDRAVPLGLRAGAGLISPRENREEVRQEGPAARGTPQRRRK
ncbi:hypothetical protein [Megalodesulfovibrio paquesii]